MKEKKTHIRTPKPPFLDFTPIHSRTLQWLMLATAVAAIGIYTPMFGLSMDGHQAGYDVQDLVLLQTFLGLSLAFGVMASGSMINKVCHIRQRKINITQQHVCQVSRKFSRRGAEFICGKLRRAINARLRIATFMM